MPNQSTTTTNKQTDKGWVCAESLLSIDGSKTVSIPHKTYYDCTTSTGLTISLIVQPSTSFRIGKKDVGGWEITYSSGTLTFTVYNTSTSLSVTKSVLVDKLSKVTVYYTTIGKIGIYVGNSNSKVESSTTITGDCTNTNPIVVSGTSYISYLSIYNKQLSDFEVDRLEDDISIIPKSLHLNCIGFWTMQERYGIKIYDSVELFNYAKGSSLTANHGDLSGYNYGTELVTNGDFSAGATGWVSDNISNWTIDTTGALCHGEAGNWIRTNVPVIGGRLYYIEVDVASLNFGGIIVFVGLNQGYNYQYQDGTFIVQLESRILTSTTGTYKGIIWASAYGEVAIMSNNGPGQIFKITRISIKEYTMQERINIYTRSNQIGKLFFAPANFPAQSLAPIQFRAELPELKNALLLDGSHTISYPLSGTVTNYINGYAYQAYKLKSGETLTDKELLELSNNGLFSNPSKAIQRKLDAYYNFNAIDTTSGNRIMDLIGTNHATLTGSGFTIVPINSLR